MGGNPPDKEMVMAMAVVMVMAMVMVTTMVMVMVMVMETAASDNGYLRLPRMNVWM